RASPHLPSFPTRRSSDLPTLDLEDIVTIAAISAQLDRLPLAIELAAARLRGLTLSEVAGSLDQRLRILRQDTRPDMRHRSLRAVDRKSTRLNSSHEWISY